MLSTPAYFGESPRQGNEVVVTNNEIDRVVEGQIVEQWVGLDMLSLMQQLGVVPTPGHGGVSDSARVPEAHQTKQQGPVR